MWPHSSADITKLILASTGHMVAPFIFLYPKFTLIALLKFASSHKFHKWFILLLFFELFTSKVFMLLYSAI
jgi:hypothetical protein